MKGKISKNEDSYIEEILPKKKAKNGLSKAKNGSSRDKDKIQSKNLKKKNLKSKFCFKK
jgi:hypothetical protein